MSSPGSDARRDFILAETRPLRPPLAPELILQLADEAVPLWSKTEEELGEMGLPPPFWAFAWAGGQALARFLLDRPELVRGRRALDFASGSGLVAIAAARAGAADVEASEIDAFAAEAIALNAAANGVRVTVRAEDIVGRDDGWDVVLAGDAAGVVAPSSGEGIYYAMLGGRLAADAADECLRTGDAKALATARKRFMKLHGRVFFILGVMQYFWYSSDKRRERFVTMCRDPDVQRLTWESYMNKELPKRDPLAQVRVFFKDLAHLLHLTAPT